MAAWVESAFVEFGAGDFSSCQLQWKELCLFGISGMIMAERTNEARTCGGGFRYQGSAMLSSPCRNRNIVWRYFDHTLEFIELSLDSNLACNALRVLISRECGPLVGGVNIVELASHVVILFATATSVHRLVLPHPEAIAKDPALALAAKGQLPSIFKFAVEESLKGINTAAIWDYSAKIVPLTCAASWMDMDGVTIFTLGSSNGVIYCLRMYPIGTTRIPERFELKQHSMMKKIYNLLPSGIRGTPSCGEALEGLEIHSFGGEVIVLAVSHDMMLRLWSCQQVECLLEHSLSEYTADFSGSDDDQQRVSTGTNKLMLRKALGGAPDGLRFAVFLGMQALKQVSVFQLLLVDSQLLLERVSTHCCSETWSVTDMTVSNEELWVIFSDHEGTPFIRHCWYDDSDTSQSGASRNAGRSAMLKDAALASVPSPEIIIPPQKYPPDAYLDEMFCPGKITSQAVWRTLQLYGMLGRGVWNDSRKLREEVQQRIEDEVKRAAAPCNLFHPEYREVLLKCWSKFYACCLEYNQLVMKPLSVVLDPSTGMVTLVRQGCLSFFYQLRGPSLLPSLPTITYSLLSPPTTVARSLQSDAVIITELLHCILNEFSEDVFESVLIELQYHSEVVPLANDIATALLSLDNNNLPSFLSALHEKVCRIADFPSVVSHLLQLVEPVERQNQEEGMREVPPEVRMAVADLFASSVSTRLLSAAFRDQCLYRLKFCRNMLILLCVLQQDSAQYQAKLQISEKLFVQKFADLVRCYHSLYWFSTTLHHSVAVSTLEATQKHLAGLDLSGTRHYFMQSEFGDCTLLERYITSSYGRNKLLTALLQFNPFSTRSPVHAHWTKLLPWIMNTLLQQLWPMRNATSLYEFLLFECQYTSLQTLHSYCELYVKHEFCSRIYLLAHSYLGTGEPQKAFSSFLQASVVLNSGAVDEPVLQRLLVSLQDKEGREGGKGAYFVRVMRLFESVPCIEWVVHTATKGLQHIKKNDPAAPILWSNVFKYSLELEHYKKAYNAMISNPDRNRRRECLRHYIVVLTDKGCLKPLCELPFIGMEEEAEQVMEQKCRSVDVTTPRYYKLLYCYHIAHNSFLKAAQCKYEEGWRLGREAPGRESLQKQADCYVTAITCLELVSPRYATLISYRDQDESAGTEKRSRVDKPSGVHPTRKLVVMTLADLKKEYQLVMAKVELVRKDNSLATQLCNQFVGADEVQSLLVQTGMYDTALRITKRHSLSFVPVFESLATRCAYLTTNVYAVRQGRVDSRIWDWLELNNTAKVSLPREPSIVDKAWNLLRQYLEKEKNKGHYSELLHCVTAKLLSLGTHLPQWLVDMYKLANVPGLLRLYLTYNLLQPAALVAIDYIDAVMGQGKEDFGLQNAIHATAPAVWLPYTALEHLMERLRTSSPDSELGQVYSNLKDKLDVYFQLEADTTRAKEE